MIANPASPAKGAGVTAQAGQKTARTPLARAAISANYGAFLDGARLIATLAVFIGHATRPDVLFDVDVSPIGRATIPVFLMLSAYLTAASFARGGVFLTAIAKRYLGLYFIVVPAIVVTLLIDKWLIAQGSPLVENIKFQADYSFSRIAREVLEALTFSGEYWRLDVTSQGLFANQAFWTIEYIMAYVFMTAAWFLLSGRTRIVTILLAAVIAGPTVLLLAPIWVAGVAAYQFHCWADGAGADAQRVLHRHAPAVFAIGLAGVIAIETTGLGADVYAWSKTWASYELRQHLGMAKRFAWQWSLVPGLFLALASARYLADRIAPLACAAWIRKAAVYTLPIYMTHFAFLYAWQALIPGYQATAASIDPYVVMLGALTSSIAFGWLAMTLVQPVNSRIIKWILECPAFFSLSSWQSLPAR